MSVQQKPLTYSQAQRILERLWAKQFSKKTRQYTYIMLIVVFLVVACFIAIFPVLIVLPIIILLILYRIGFGLKKQAYPKSENISTKGPQNSYRRYSIPNEPDNGLEYNPSKHTSNKLWLLALSKDFLKSVAKIDRKLQGRILDAISAIVENPLTPAGDTKTPLTGDKSGNWRYRIGSYRIIYRPDTDTHVVEILTFVERGTAYRTRTA